MRITLPESGRARGRSRPTCWPRREIGSLRAEALVLLAELESLDRAVALLEEALREAASRPALQSRHPLPARVGDALQERACGPRARAALELADELDDDALRVAALAPC